MTKNLSEKIKSLLCLNKYTSSLFVGWLLALTLPPFNLIPFVFASFSLIYILIARSNKCSESFLIGWWFGFGYFSTGLYWFAYALLIDVKIYGWLIPFAVFGLSGLFAIYFGCASFLCKLFNKKGFLGLVIFSTLFTLAEWCLGHFFTGFPWNLFAYTWSFSIIMLQTASITGAYGLVFITIMCGASIGVSSSEKSKFSLLFGVTILASMIIFGWIRLSNSETDFYQNVKIRLVQANIPIKKQHGSIQDKSEILIKYKKMTNQTGIGNVHYVIWPESAIPFIVSKNEKDLLSYIKPSHNNLLITGGMSVANQNDLYNSLFVINGSGKIVKQYNKYHLVPFGEFVPFWETITKIAPFIGGIAGNFAHGSEKNMVININNLPGFTPLICYEVIFPDEVTNPSNKNDNKKTKWLLNITNDGWFGESAEPYQHFAMARMRSIEEGIPLVRSANSGISAIIDSYGRVIDYLPTNSSGIIDSNLPKPIDEGTFYTKLRGWIRALFCSTCMD